MTDKKGFVYIMANQKNGTIYVGVTSNLQTRVLEHIHSKYEGFTNKYGCHTLVRFQEFPDIQEAITWEKKIKGRTRSKKLKMIEKDNPLWRNLFEGI